MNTQNPEPEPSRKKIVGIIAVLVVVAAGTYSVPVYLAAQPACPSGAPLRSFSIVANDTSGYNNSRSQPFTISVQKGDCVRITFVNESIYTAHGLAIQTYTPKVIVAPSGETKTTEFHATQTGTFRIWEDFFSPTYVFNRGVLNVT